MTVNGQDYAAENILAVTFDNSTFPGPPSDSECVSILILDDDVLEGNHDFRVSLIDVGLFALLGQPLTTTVTISDDESE